MTKVSKRKHTTMLLTHIMADILQERQQWPVSIPQELTRVCAVLTICQLAWIAPINRLHAGG